MRLRRGNPVAVREFAILGFGTKRIDRVRGSGYLDCPRCHEHALQDVIDEMTFLTALYYRLAPVRRRRILLCQRCLFRRTATPAEMKLLNTAGERIRRAWLVPIGLLGLGLTYVMLVAFIAGSQNSLPSGFTFVSLSGEPAMPANLDVPSLWTQSILKDAKPAFLVANDTSGQNLSLKLIRDPATTNITDLVKTYFSDPRGLSAVGYPDTPPQGVCDNVAGETAYFVTVDYRASDQAAQLRMYFFVHQHVGYVLYFGGATDVGIATMHGVAEHVLPTVKFTANEPKPSPGTTPTPSAIATATATATAAPDAGATAVGPSSSAAASPSARVPANCS